MVKASALYIVIIIALVIGVICSALVVSAYFYKNQYQRKSRYDQLENNLGSAVNLILAGDDTLINKEKTLSLFGGDADSVSLQKFTWGLYDMAVAKAFIQKDTLYKVFSIANSIDSAKWAAVYLVDEERPFSLSGKTTLRGDAYIPKAGVQEAYVDGKAYQGDKRLIIGKRHLSEKQLPALNNNRLNTLVQFLSQKSAGENSLPKTDSVSRSFLQSCRIFNFKKQVQTIQNINLNGNIVLFSDTTIILDSTAILKDVLVFARAIEVKTGFHGNCQLFAADTIHIGSHCHFTYPSCLGVLRFAASAASIQEKIILDGNTSFSGILFTYEKTVRNFKPTISIGKNTTVIGQIYAQGALDLKDQSEVDGSVFTTKFLYKNAFTLFENYLINIIIDTKALSPYYLTSDLLPVAEKNKRVLQWIAAN